MASFKQEKDHIIICGYGVVGQKIGEVLGEHMIDFVVVDNNDSLTSKLEEQELKVIRGDATSSKTLKEAGIVGAKAIAVVMDNDAKNLFSVLTACNVLRLVPPRFELGFAGPEPAVLDH